MDHRFVIDVHDVPTHEGSWTFPIPQEWGRSAFEGCEVEALEEPGQLVVEVTKTGEGYLVQGRVQLAVAATCARCLKPMPLELEASISALYVPGSTAGVRPAPERKDEGEDEDEAGVDDGPDVEHFQDQRLVLDPYVRDTILLEVPMNPRCAVECRLPERPTGAS